MPRNYLGLLKRGTNHKAGIPFIADEHPEPLNISLQESEATGGALDTSHELPGEEPPG